MPYGDQAIGPILDANGYKYVDGSGYGPNAKWKDKDGATFSQRAIANSLLGNDSPYSDKTITSGGKTYGIDQETGQFTVDLGGAGLASQQPNVGNSPDIRYDATGQAYEWDGKNWQPSSRFNDPTKAAGYRAPSTAAPPLPQTYTDQRTGDLVGVDARTGTEVYRIPGATWATLSPAQQQQVKDADTLAARQFALQQASTQNNFTSAENDKTRAATAANQQQQQGFTALQNDKQNAFTAGQAGTGRAFTANESANSRALAAAEFAAQQEAQQQGFDFQVQQANRAGEADASTRRLAAANQYANLVSSTDTAALPAYLAAGGGTLFNARANPNAPSLLTDNAINPAASSLRDARTIAWQPITAKPIQGFQQPAYQQWQEPAYGQAAQTPGAAVPQQQQAGSMSAPAATVGRSADNLATIRAAQSLGIDTSQQAPGFAGGSNGFIPAPQQGFYTSERGPEFMQVVDPPGPHNAQIRVVPNGQGMGFNGLPGYADGTSADPNGMGIDPNGLDPYAAEVRQFRSTFNAPQYGFSQFDPRFSRQLSNGMQQSYFMGQQTQSGAPAEALQHEASYYTPRGYYASPYHVTPDLAY